MAESDYPTDYARRLAQAMGIPTHRGPESGEIGSLAKNIKVTYQAIAKIFTGETTKLSAPNNSKAAKHLKVDPDWLATGEGSMYSERVWPLGDQIKPADFFTLDPAAVQPALDVIIAAIARHKSTRQSGEGGDEAAQHRPRMRA